jgi:hypothetical protein
MKDPNRIYDQHRNAFAAVTAAVVLHDGKLIARIAVKHGNAATAYVHFLGAPMMRGQAGGGGYDKTSAAIDAAARKIVAPEGEKWNLDRALCDKFTTACILGSNGNGWDRSLREAGFDVHQAV